MMQKQADINLIDNIISQREQQVLELEIQRRENITIITVDNIFTSEENTKGLISKESYKRIFSTFSGDELKALEAYYQAMRNKTKINTTPFTRTDKNGIEYYWMVIQGKNGKQEFKLRYFKGLDQILITYLSDLYAFELDFGAMYHESLK